MEHSFREQILSFAGIWQAIAQVNKVARTGQINRDDFSACIDTLFVTNPQTTDDVYGSVARMRTGLQVILDQFGDASDQRDLELTKYAISVLHLERKLAKHPDIMDKIGQGIDTAKGQATHFSNTHENVIAALADLYANTISTIPPKVIIQGEEGHLNNSANAAKVRALLLSAIRSAILWHQCGGRRLTLPFKRSRILQQAKALLNEID